MDIGDMSAPAADMSDSRNAPQCGASQWTTLCTFAIAVSLTKPVSDTASFDWAAAGWPTRPVS